MRRHGINADGVAIFAGDVELGGGPLERGDEKGHRNFNLPF